MMSSQFSYDLDERHIRLTMQDAELEGSETLWQKFEGLSVADSKSSVSVSHLIPSFNLSISRSIVVPLLFIVLIGGLSAMLFSFIDFKKKESIDKEIPLVANPENFKKPETVTANDESPKIEKMVVAKNEVAERPNTITTVTAKKQETAKTIVKKTKTPVVVTVEPKKESVLKPYVKKRNPKVKAEVIPTINATTITNLNDESTEPELDLK